MDAHAPRVLVVEDDDEIRDYLALALEMLDCVVDTAAGVESVPPDLRPDVALVDLLFRDGQSSLGLIERLSAVGVRVVVMTGLSLEAPPVRQALAAGACSALAKPFSLDAVRALVRGVTPD
ncbi:MAG: response regulator [Myxococcales bacterium]|nr:response regulator [Myxococcales bacterium]